MEQNHPLTDLLATTIGKVRELMDANTVVGTPIHAGDVTIIPVSKLSIGFGSGGSDFSHKQAKPGDAKGFGGGGGAGVNLTPVAFLVIKGDGVKLLPVAQGSSGAAERAVELVPEMFDKVTEFVEKKKDKDVL